MHAIQTVFIMQMSGCCQARRADIAYDLALPDTCPLVLATRELGQVCIERRDIPTMLNNDAIAVAAVSTSENNRPVTCCFDRRAFSSRVVDASMGALRLQNRMLAVGVEI